MRATIAHASRTCRWLLGLFIYSVVLPDKRTDEPLARRRADRFELDIGLDL